MRILFTCGGTAGHINPAVALARVFRERHRDCQVLFVGAKGGMETRLIPKEGFPCETVESYQLEHSWDPEAIVWNIKVVSKLHFSVVQAGKLLDGFRPDLVVGTGGYASYPVVKAAAGRHIPTAIHESNVLPGMTTKALSGLVDVVMVGFAAAVPHYGRAKRVEVTGTPVRPDFFRFTRAQAREELGIPQDERVVLCFWGSLGAARMNEYMADFFARAVKDGTPFRLIQSAGRGFAAMTEALRERGVELENHPRLDLREYIYDMPAVMAACDLVLCRAGAATLSEVAAVSKPAILVPSPNVTADHQTPNARALADGGGAILLPEGECSGGALYRLVAQLLSDAPRRERMGRAMGAMSAADASEAIYRVLRSIM